MSRNQEQQRMDLERAESILDLAIGTYSQRSDNGEASPIEHVFLSTAEPGKIVPVVHHGYALFLHQRELYGRSAGEMIESIYHSEPNHSYMTPVLGRVGQNWGGWISIEEYLGDCRAISPSIPIQQIFMAQMSVVPLLIGASNGFPDGHISMISQAAHTGMHAVGAFDSDSETDDDIGDVTSLLDSIKNFLKEN